MAWCISTAAVAVVVAVVLSSLCPVESGKLYYKPGSDLCPDGHTSCHDSTCCLIQPNEYACCYLKNAVCCKDRIHCCPHGSECAQNECVFRANTTNTTTTTKTRPPVQAVRLATRGSSTSGHDVVEGKKKPVKSLPKCPSNHTVCPSDNGDLGCCPHPDAICCGGNKGLCCPGDHTCNLESNKCEKRATKVWKGQAAPTVALYNEICPDAQTYCTTNTTCCLLADGEYGCCPYPNAVCCTDHLHCCPEHSTCDISSRTCILQNHRKVPFAVKGSPASTTAVAGKLRLRLQGNLKPSNNDRNNHDNHNHDNVNKLQQQQQPSSSSSSPDAVVQRVDDTLCPDNSSCSGADTCCAMNTGVWGCCSYTHAVCCADYMHCCPQNFVCDLPKKRCIRPQAAVSMLALNSAKQQQQQQETPVLTAV
ncbi:progranulin-like isoform X1 [Argonauta hians]